MIDCLCNLWGNSKQEINNGIAPENIILAGFSQGATIALRSALSMDEQIGGVVALSMWHLPSVTGAEAAQASKREGKLPVLFCHGANDQIITADFAQHKCSEMTAALDVQYAQFDGLAHSVSADELLAVRTFLLSKIPGNAKYDSLNALPPTYRSRLGAFIR
jgi:phospholipase/carboxylesterase